MTTKIITKDGVKWTYRIRRLPQSKAPYVHAPVLYTAHYKCDRCGEKFIHVYQGGHPLDTQNCTHVSCSSPSFLAILLRQIKRQKIWGLGRLVSVEVNTWESDPDVRNL